MIKETPVSTLGPGKCWQSRSHKQPYKITAFSISFKGRKGDCWVQCYKRWINIKIF
jgi:hypothetical protein